MRWLHRGTGEITAVARAILEVAPQKGMRVETMQTSPGHIDIHLTSCLAWYRVVLYASPQCIQWSLTQVRNRYHLSYDSRLRTWYVAVILVTCVLSGVLLLGGAYRLASGSWDRLETWHRLLDVLMAFGGVVLLFGGYRQVNALGGSRTIEFWQAIRQATESPSGLLRSRRTTASPRYILATCSYLAYAVALLVGTVAILGLDGLDSDPVVLLAICGLLVCIVCLALCLVPVARNRGFDGRFEAMVPGITTCIAMLFVAVAPFPWFVARDAGAPEIRSQMQQIVGFLRERPEGYSFEEYVRRRAQAEQAGWTMGCLGLAGMAVGLVVLSVALGFVVMGIRVSTHTWLARERLERFAEHPSLHGTVSGGDYLPALRGLVVTVVLFVSLITLGSIASTTCCALVVLLGEGRGLPVFAERAVGSSQVLIAAACGQLEGSSLVRGFVDAGWVVLALCGLGAFVASTGQLVVSRYRRRRQLEMLAGTRVPDQDKTHRLLQGMAEAAGLPTPRLVVRTHDAGGRQIQSMYARTYRYGVFRPTYYIEVSAVCLARFTSAQLEALLAHEVIHCSQGHCTRDLLVRWLGRICFVGDQAVRMFQHTLRYEFQADRMAVAIMTDRNPSALIECLQRIRQRSAVCGAAELDGLAGLPLGPARRDPSVSARMGGWRQALQRYVWQYTSSQGSLYWHPSFERRLAELRQMQAACEEQGACKLA